MRALTALILIGLLAQPAAAFDRPTRPTAPPPGTGPVTRPMGGATATAEAEAEAPTLPRLTAAEAAPGDFLWQGRPVVIFADTDKDPEFIAQLREIDALPAPLIERGVSIVTDTDPGAESPWRQMLRPRGFSLVLIDTDGRVVIRKPLPWSAREIARSIDKLPSRRDEVRGRQVGR